MEQLATGTKLFKMPGHYIREEFLRESIILLYSPVGNLL
jgi:hypothetical protein